MTGRQEKVAIQISEGKNCFQNCLTKISTILLVLAPPFWPAEKLLYPFWGILACVKFTYASPTKLALL